MASANSLSNELTEEDVNSPIAGVDLNVDQLGMTTHGSLYNAHNT